MPILNRLRFDSPPKTFTAKMPEDTYNALVEYALNKRFTLTSAITHLINKALYAENGEAYKPD